MNSLFKRYKPVIRFVVLFLGSYVILSFVYALYLEASKGGTYHPDFVTHLVGKQSSDVISSFNYDPKIIPAKSIPSLDLYVNGRYLARIAEGCNAISIIILFIAFVIAFAEKFKKTFLFLFAGAVLIYCVNIVRIVLLSILLFEYPQHLELLHGVVFPAIIYGMVFLLWMVWVRMLKHNKSV